MRNTLKTATILVVAGLVLAACERPPVETEQLGFRGMGMVQVVNPRRAEDVVVPATQPAADQGGPKARDIYQNVQVLGDLSVGEFVRTMNAVTEWVSPEQGCNYCHIPTNLASDDIYTKVVSRRMFQMTRHINAQWDDHVGQTGVTCYSCHAGKPVPEYIWFEQPADDTIFAGNRMGQNRGGVSSVAYASLPMDPFTSLLSGDGDGQIRVIHTGAFPPAQPGASIQATEKTYGLMMHMSAGLGVNCTYCHGPGNFAGWENSRPQRITAWHGIQMVKALNSEYLSPLQPVYPDQRLGAAGDAPKTYCTTCHQGLPKPLNGAEMAKEYPALWTRR